MPDDSDDILDDVTKQDAKRKRALRILLDDQQTKEKHHLVLRVRMGEVSSYLTSVDLSWVADNVGFAADLPVFKASAQETGGEAGQDPKHVLVDSGTIESIQQRQPNWSRQRFMTAYLARRRHHKFPPLLLVGYQDWVYKSNHEKWGIDRLAEYDSLTVTSLDSRGAYFDLDVSDTNFYALDGQHRLMAIMGLKELIRGGHLHALKEDRTPKKTDGLNLDGIVTEISEETGEAVGSVHARLQRLLDEKIGIEIVPAVISGERYGQAVARLRQMFVDVNEHAKPLTKGELSALDEANGYRVVARKIMGEHDLLRSTSISDNEIRFKVEIKKWTLTESSPAYTTLKTLTDVVQTYLCENESLGADNSVFRKWDQVGAGVYGRPEESAIEKGQVAMKEYFDALSRLPSHESFIQGTSASSLRDKEGGDNILFRPMAQLALAEAIGKLATRGTSLDRIAKELGRQDESGGLRLTSRTQPWFGVLCDPTDQKMRRHKSSQQLCSRMFVYLLGGGIEDDLERAELRNDFAEARRIDDETAIDLQGKSVPIESVRLPSPWV